MTKERAKRIIYLCHESNEVFEMFNSDNEMLSACSEEPTLIFTLIKNGEFEAIKLLIDKNLVDVNACDTVGNDVVCRLLKSKQYDLVIRLMKKRNWLVNHQNVEGNTFGHILAQDNSMSAMKVVDVLTSKSNFMPNIKNNKGETILDKSINNHYILTAFKILEDKRFTDINVASFSRLLNACVKSNYYGKYSKLNNLEVIVNNLDKKELVPSMETLITEIKDNWELIKNEIMNNKAYSLDALINSQLVATA